MTLAARGPPGWGVPTRFRVVVPGAVSIVAAVAAVVLVPGVGLGLNRPWWRRLFAGTGWEHWRSTASQLLWRDRVRLELANGRGRAASPELAALAMQRGRVLGAMSERAQARPILGRVYLLIALSGSLIALLSAGLVLSGDGSGWTWSVLAIWTALTVLYAEMPRLQRRRMRGVRRSVECNRATLQSLGAGVALDGHRVAAGRSQRQAASVGHTRRTGTATES